MKKLLFVMSTAVLLSAGCNNSTRSAIQPQPAVTQSVKQNAEVQNKGMPANPSASVENTAPLVFGCKDLITDAQMQVIIGALATFASQVTNSSTAGIICQYNTDVLHTNAMASFVVNRYSDRVKLLFGDTYSIFIARTDKIEGLGYEAIHQEPYGVIRVTMISSNKKYTVDGMISFLDNKKSNMAGTDVQKSIDANVAALKIIDGNLNKY